MKDDSKLSPAASAVERPLRPSEVSPRIVFTRGRKRPRGVAWFGVSTFWGHMQHFIASAIATNDIDSRDWMEPDDPFQLADSIARELGGEATGKSLVESMGRDVWIDFLADTGDDVEVSGAVADMFARTYELPNPEDPEEWLVAPRGDLLICGGDTAYPVSTAGEIHDRFVVPFNRTLIPRSDHKKRALLGIPGNHDWYGGLDGFARMFRKRVGDLTPEQAEASTTLDRDTQIGAVVEWAEQFVVGGSVTQRKTLVLDDYTPMQSASYFILPLTSKMHVFGVDRQLRSVDFRQRRFFERWRKDHADPSLLVLLPDPVYSFLEPSPTGVAMVEALNLDLEHRNHMMLAGDIHHYERFKKGASTHVVAGGGGAFLHPARIARKGFEDPTMEWPNVQQSRPLLFQVPIFVALGRAGYLPHLAFLSLYLPALGIGSWVWGNTNQVIDASSLVAAAVAAVVCALLGGWRRGRFVTIFILASITGMFIGIVPDLASFLVSRAMHAVGARLHPAWHTLIQLIFAVYAGAFAFGAYLVALTLYGLENSQALTALGHPGYRHFLRMRVRKEGDAIDVWCLGRIDPLRSGEPTVLVDSFTWRAGDPEEKAK